MRLTALTILSFCSGVVRAKTLTPAFRRRAMSASRIVSSASPVRTASAGALGGTMPARSAIARAVSG
jgi:hypothetical protein